MALDPDEGHVGNLGYEAPPNEKAEAEETRGTAQAASNILPPM
jgi:hypothetical protein